jgi:hypothetical protein
MKYFLEKRIHCILLCLLPFALLSGFLLTSHPLSLALIGEWNCRSLASDQITATEFYHLSIQPSGSFSLYDQEAGNPGISGKMTPKKGTNQLKISCTTDDFDPPVCWDLSSQDTLFYQISADDQTLFLRHNGVDLIFDKAQ